MNRNELEDAFLKEFDQWSSKPYEELRHMEYPVAYDNGKSGKQFYQTEVDLLERGENFVRVSVVVDDGGLGAFFTTGRHFVARADGSVEKPQQPR